MANFTPAQLENPNPLQERNTWPLTDRLTWALGLPVKPSVKLVAVAIVMHANKTTGLAWPGMGRISEITGLSRRQVIYAIKALEAGGHLHITRLKVGKVNASNRYRLPAMGGQPTTIYSGAQAAPTKPSSAQVALPSAQVALPSAQVAPEPVIEPVKEPKEQEQRAREPRQDIEKAFTTKNGRATCTTCGNSWPASYAGGCHKCRAKQQRQPEPEPEQANEVELPAHIERLGDLFRCKVHADSWRVANGAKCHTCSSVTGSIDLAMWKCKKRKADEARAADEKKKAEAEVAENARRDGWRKNDKGEWSKTA